MPSEQRYVYCFSVWPDVNREFKDAILDVFHALDKRIEMNFTEEEFKIFRKDLLSYGLCLHEIGRWVYVPPEAIP